MPNTGNVDERILQMRIDHDEFEKGAKKTLGILEKLDEGLRFLGAKHVDGFDNIASALDKVTNKISVFGTVGDQVIRTLTNKAMELVGQMGHLANALTVDQIAAGWSKYAEKTQGVQTIMAATAKDWEDQGAQMEWVNAQLEKLNWFTDETSYNFLDMVNNIGKFTSNGVNLETAVTAMEGISTWAALSGANVNEASRAMYNLSQALATGSVKLIDWKSIENANMATREFKETALETAKALGKLTKVGNKWKTLSGKEFTTEQFNTQLSEGWFTSDVLLKTLEQYGSFTDALNEATEATDTTATEFLQAMEAYEKGEKVTAELIPWIKKLSAAEYELGRKAFRAAQEAKTYEEAIAATKDAVSTGWMNLFETMFGNYLTAKELWTDVANLFYDIFAEPINQLNEIVSYAFKGVNPLADQLAIAGSSMGEFEAAAAAVEDDDLQALIKEFGSVEEAIKAGKLTAEQFQLILGKLQDIRLDNIINGKNTTFNTTLEGMQQAAEWLREGTYTREQIKALGYDMKMIDFWVDAQERMRQVNGKEVDLIPDKDFLSQFYNTFSDDLLRLAGYTDEEIELLKQLGIGAEDVLSQMTDPKVTRAQGFKLFGEALTNLLETVSNVATAFRKALGIIFGGSNNEEVVNETLGEKLYNLIVRFNEFSVRVKDASSNINGLAIRFSNILRVISPVTNTIRKFVSGVVEAIKKSGILQSFGRAIGSVFRALITPIKIVYNFINRIIKNRRELGKVSWVQVLTSVFSKLGDVVEKLAKKFEKFMTSEKLAVRLNYRLIKIYLWLKKVFSYIEKLYSDYKENGISGVFRIISESIDKLLEKHPTLQKIWNFIKEFFKNVKEAFKGIDFSGLFKDFSFSKLFEVISQVATTIYTYILNLFGKLFAEDGPLSQLKGLIGPALLVLIGSGIYSTIRKVKKVVGGFGDLIENISGILKKVKKGPSKFQSFVKNFLMIAISIGILAGSLFVLAKLNWEELLRGWLGITAILLSMMLFMKYADTAKGIGAGSLIAMALTVVILAGTLKSLAKMTWDDLLKGWLGISAILLSMMLFMNKADTAKGTGGWSLIAMALTVVILASTLKSLAKMTWDDLLKGWLGISAILLSMMLFMSKADTAKGTGGWSLIAMALTVVILASTLKSLAKLSWDDLLKGWLGISAILLSMMLFMSKADTAKGTGALSLIGMALTVVILAGTLKSLAKLSWDDLLKGWLAITGILLSMMLFMSKADTAKGTGALSLIGMALTVVILAGTLKSLAKLNAKQLLIGWLGITAILLSMMLFMKYAESSDVSLKSILVLAGAAVAMSLLAIPLMILAKCDWKSLLAAGVAMSLCFITIISAITILSAMSPATAAKGLLVLAIIVGGVALILWGLIELGGVIVDSAIKLAEKLHAFAESMKPFIESISGFDDSTSASFDRFAGMMLSIMKAEFWTMLASWFAKLGDGEALAAELSAFMSGLQSFLTDVTNVTEASTTGAGYLASLMSTLLGAQITSLVGSWFDGLNADYATGLSSFMTAFVPFTTSVSSVTADTVTGAGYLAATMSSLLGAQITSLVGSWFDGLNADYATGLSSFMTAFSPFTSSVSSVTADTVTGAGYLAATMSSLLGAQITSLVGSWFDGLTAEIGTKLSGFVVALVPFTNYISRITADTVTGAENLTSLMETLVGGQFWATIGDFFNGLTTENANQLTGFITNLQPFLDKVSTIGDDDVASAGRLGEVLKASIGAQFWGMVSGWFKGNNVANATQLSNFTTALLPFLDAMASITDDTITRTQSTMDMLADLNKNDVISDFGDQLNSFYSHFQDTGNRKAYVEEDFAQFALAITYLQDFANALSTLSLVTIDDTFGLDIITQIGTGIELSETTLTLKLVTTIKNAISSSVSNGSVLSSAWSAGAKIISGLAAGVTDNLMDAYNAGVSAGNEVVRGFQDATQIESPSRVFMALAEYIPAGIAKGVENNTSEAVDSMTILSSSVLAAMQMAMAQVAAVADEDFDISPRITPVVDMSDVEFAAGATGRAFGSVGTAVRGSMRLAMDTMQANNNPRDNGSGNIVNEIRTMSAKLDGLESAVSSMQIVLDTGTLVGSTSKKMDAALGTAQARKNRAN